MDNTFPYSGTLTAEQFLFHEIRIVAKLYLQEKTLDEILSEVKSNNLFQYPTERQISRLTRACYKRILALNSLELVKELANGPIVIAKQINVYAMMRYNRIIWEFMILIIGEKYSTNDLSFDKKDVNKFFTRLQEQNDDIASWSENTITKIKQVIVKMLVEAEFLDNNRSTKLNPVYLYQELEEAIKENNDNIVLKAFNFFN